MQQIILILIQTIQIVSNLLGFAIIARVLMSWVKPGMEHQSQIGRVLHDITEPIYDIARMVPHRVGMIDLSPIVAIVGIDIISFVVVEILKRLLV